MKLRNTDQLRLLTAALLSEQTTPQDTQQLQEAWLLHREPMIKKLVNFRKHQQGKSAWRGHRWSFMKGIRQFHKGTEGKRFHRTLGRWLATKIFRPKMGNQSLLQRNEETLTSDPYDVLVALSSIKTHLYLERSYFNEQLESAVDIAYLVEYAAPLLHRLEEKLFEDDHVQLTNEELELLLRLIDRRVMLKCCEEYTGNPSLTTQYTAVFESLKQQCSPESEGFLVSVMTQVAACLEKEEET